MPKENINDETCPGWRVEVSWRPNNDEHSPNTPGHVQVASVNQHSTFAFPGQLLDYGPNGEELYDDPEPFDGWRVTLNEAGIDRMIEALSKARDAAFPRPIPASLKGCRACGNPDAMVLCDEGTELTYKQWYAHANHEYYDSQEHGASKDNAWDYAVSQTTSTYGPAPDKPADVAEGQDADHADA